MASIVVGSLVLNVASNLPDARIFPTLSKLSPAPTMNGAVREYAGGRFRAIGSAGSQIVLAASIMAASRGDVQWLEARMGQAMLTRDSTGRKFYGIYYTVGITEYNAALNVADVDLSIAQISFSEIV